jgi:Na+/H+-dicarboxylate symporter
VVLYFAATLAGLPLTPECLLALTLLALVASVITPPVSHGSLIALTLVFSLAALPPAGIAMAIAVPLIGKLNTPMNLLGRVLALRLMAGSHTAPCDQRNAVGRRQPSQPALTVFGGCQAAVSGYRTRCRQAC